MIFLKSDQALSTISPLNFQVILRFWVIHDYYVGIYDVSTPPFCYIWFPWLISHNRNVALCWYVQSSDNQSHNDGVLKTHCKWQSQMAWTSEIVSIEHFNWVWSWKGFIWFKIVLRSERRPRGITELGLLIIKKISRKITIKNSKSIHLSMSFDFFLKGVFETSPQIVKMWQTTLTKMTDFIRYHNHPRTI